MENLPLLPQSLLQRILGFAVPGYVEDLAPARRTTTIEILKELKLVAKAWFGPLREIVQQYEQSAVALVFRTASCEEIDQMYHTVETRGNNVTQLYVSMGTITNYKHSRKFNMRPDLTHKAMRAYVNWMRIFANLPNLQELNLAEMPLDSLHVLAILDVTSTHCFKIECLTLPFSENEENEECIHEVLEILYEVLKRWRVAGNLGVRRLRIPTPTSKDPYRVSKEFFHNVMASCPQVEYLDGYKMSLFTSDCLACKDVRLLSLRDWEKFNATCTNLREFNWIVFPFGDPYFRVFGEHIKPRLQKLTFGVSMTWSWRGYFDINNDAGNISNEIYRERPGYWFLASDVGAALKGCPWLNELEIQLYHPKDIDADDHELYSDFPEHEIINANVFDDQFCECLASYCPYVSRFAIVEVAETYNAKSMSTIQTFTDKGLMALTRLKFLQSLKLRNVNCTGVGVFHLLNNLSDEFIGNRVFEICIGGNESMLSFYEAVQDLLLRIAETSNLPCSHRKFVLRIVNCSCSFVDAEWSKTYLLELEKLMARVKNTHPSLRQLVITMDRRGKSFKRIAEFGLYSVHADPSLYSEWVDWEDEDFNEGVAMMDRADGDIMDYDYH